jgi:peptidoglycan/xylan/chitin deacetylase (PgdA/CDA1 family)
VATGSGDSFSGLPFFDVFGRAPCTVHRAPSRPFLVAFLALLLSCGLFGQNRNLLSSKYTLPELQDKLIPLSQWTPFPKPDDREGWAKADRTMLQHYVREAEACLDYDWPAVPATLSLAFVRTGNRSDYENVSFRKRVVLGTLLLAEIAENKGRFIDPILNGVWSLCEESWWGASAHLPPDGAHAGLVDVTQPEVDLFASETALILAWVDYFLGEKLDAVSPQIRKRIYYEVERRLFQPFMNKYHWWMGESDDGRGPNNWNPWICSNWIHFVLLLEKDPRKRAEMIFKSLQILDEFINWYPPDGGCDEGPSYWGGAASRMYDCVAMLNLASNQAFHYVFDDGKVKNMARYIYRAQISEDYFLNFADADPKVNISAAQVYLFGKDIGDLDMMAFGAYYRKPVKRVSNTAFYGNLFALFAQAELLQAPQRLPLLREVWLPDLQVMAVRDKGGATDGFYVAAKGGHNAEAHNHNDVGSFVVYYDGQPLLIDVGRGTYTARTFNDRRYEIWFNRSDYHNLPTVNGVDQSPAIEYKASKVSCTLGRSPAFSADIAGAYPAEAGIRSWKRTVTLQRGQSVRIRDEVELTKTQSVVQHLMTCYPSEVGKPGEVIVHYRTKEGRSADFVIRYNPAQMSASVEKVGLASEEDEGIRQRWGETIHRINFEVLKPGAKEVYGFTVERAKTVKKEELSMRKDGEAKSAAPEGMKWPEGKTCAIVLTYDDGLPSHLQTAIPQLDGKGFKGTFYLYGQTVARENIAEWRKISRNGHELGNHSLYHPCSGKKDGAFPCSSLEDYTTAAMLREIAVMNQFLYSIDGDTVRSYAYPCGQSGTGDGDYALPLGQSGLIRFARGGNGNPVITDFERLDPFHVPALAAMTGEPADRLIDFCRTVAERKGLGILLFHGIGGDYLDISAETHQELLDYLAAHTNIWVAPFREVMEGCTVHGARCTAENIGEMKHEK